MIRFLFNGLMRDKNRSLFPVIIVSFGVILTTVLYSFMNGVFNDMIDGNARFDTGHVKIMTRAYHEISNQVPNDLCLADAGILTDKLNTEYPGYDWSSRIKYGGLIDIPDENGETRAQSPVMGFALDLLNPDSKEIKRMNIEDALVKGKVIEKQGEILITDELANKLNIKVGEAATLISSTSNGSMAIQNFIIVGTINFGMIAIDRGAMIADISDIQYTLDMMNCTGEILGFRKDMIYNSEEAVKISQEFNLNYSNTEDEFSPIMITLEQQNGLGEYLNYAKSFGFIIVFIFVFAMSIVLWNTGLMSGIRRYGEVGVRLALGESKGHIYKTLIYESVYVGLIGSVLGTLIGLCITYYFQEVGFDITENFKNSSVMVSNIITAQITATSYYIGFVPGLLATVLGAAFAGIAVFKRQTASLFKELET